jgi:hypothetical protein
MGARHGRFLLSVVLLAGCNSSTGKPRVDGFDPPAPQADEVEFDGPIIPAIPPGTDVTYCSYLDAHIADETDIVHFRVFQSLAGHHVILFAAKQDRPVDTHLCTEDDMVNTRFIAGGGAESIGTIEIPEGLAFRIPAGTQLMMQTHWVNATPNTVDGQAIAYLTGQPSSSSRQVLVLFNVVLTDIDIPAGQKLTKSTSCTMKKDMQLFTLTGHEHEWGSHVDIELIDGNSSSMLWSHDWQPQFQSAPPYNKYTVAQPLLFKTGQQVKVTCTWDNTTGTSDVRFPQEMCVSSSFYFPAVDGEIDCVNGAWGG